MNKTKVIYIIIILITLLFINTNKSFAQSQIQVNSNKNTIQKEEEIEIQIKITDTEIATGKLEIYWNTEKLEYISGPENSNKLDNRILYTWVNSNAKNIEEINIEKFTFKGIENGTANIVATGEFYNSNGEKVEINNNNIEVEIADKIQTTGEINEQQNISDSDSSLSVLRLNHEGISPEFNSNIKEYYFIAHEGISNLQVTAIPKNNDANITVSGNTNLQFGKNTIKIKVESKDKKSTSEYKIYVTRTKNLELANANLETLAVREATLNPEFSNNITQYNIEIPTGISKIDILAIPQKEKATVEIKGNTEMKIGDNKIQIIVHAEDKITNKKYEINVHRRNQEEETKKEEEEKAQAERLATILEEKQAEETENNNETQQTKGTLIYFIIAIIAVGIVITAVIYYFIRKNK